MTITHVIGMSHSEQEPMESGRYHDIIHWDIIHHDVIHFAFTKMADSQNFRQKTPDYWLPSIYTFFGLIFQKPLTCIRNNIILHVYHNLKFNKNWWKTAYHINSVPCVVMYAPCVCVCVWCQTSEFCTILPDKLITGDIKIFVQNKIFSRPTDPSSWTVCNRNQTIILSRPNNKIALHSQCVA